MTGAKHSPCPDNCSDNDPGETEQNGEHAIDDTRSYRTVPAILGLKDWRQPVRRYLTLPGPATVSACQFPMPVRTQ
jgi:hypothetical protein